MFGARAAHSASDSSSASLTADPSCSALSSPACAAAAIAGNDSNARAVSTVSRIMRSETPSREAIVTSIWPRSSSTRTIVNSSVRASRWTRTNSSRPRPQPLARVGPQLIKAIGHIEHPMIKSWGYDTYRTPGRCDTITT